MTAPILGYRELTAEEIRLINEGKALAVKVSAYIAELRGYGLDFVGQNREKDGLPVLDQRWISIGETHLQQGFMALTRAIAQPTTF